MQRIRSAPLKLLSLTVSVALAGCTAVNTVPPGTPYKDVISQFGNPAVSCPAANGGTRMIWTQEPSGEQAWATTVGSDKRIGPFTQVLTRETFQKLTQGNWSAGQVRCEFGPPAQTQVFSDSPNQITWEYRYIGEGTGSYMMLFIAFDRATNRMVGFSTGPDPQLNPSVIGN